MSSITGYNNETLINQCQYDIELGYHDHTTGEYIVPGYVHASEEDVQLSDKWDVKFFVKFR